MKKLIVLMSLACTLQAAPPEAFWKALHEVEASGRVGPIRGDNGAALGPYQITRAYWKDSRVAGSYGQCASLAYSRKVATAYLKRYAPRSWASGNCQVLARIHNGGPTGYRKKSTLKYWRRFQKAMKP